MSHLQDKIYTKLPNAIQNCLITLFDLRQYKKRHSGNYLHYLEFYNKAQHFTLEEIKERQKIALAKFLMYARENSKYYQKVLSGLSLDPLNIMQEYSKIPVQTKEDIRSNIANIHTIEKKKSILSKTGGTTGKSMEVRFTYDDMQNRFAILDLWRSKFGYKLGEKVAWFSGKSLLTARDVKKHRYWKYDFLYKKRYYSTFHINQHTIKYYIDDINRFKPLFGVGFPSSLYEIAKWGIENNYRLNYRMKTIFPTAETIIAEEKEVIEYFFGGRIVNQYASSEGAPFILECNLGNLHLELLSGYFELLDGTGKPANEGELVFTSFTTHGTPLVRYSIKDVVVSSNNACTCGNNNPVVLSIQGRVNDFIYSKERGKINLGNVSNCVKYVNGVVKFQIVQDKEDHIDVFVVKSSEYSNKDENLFRKELVQRLGESITIDFHYTNDIPKESSGKYRIVKQSLTLT